LSVLTAALLETTVGGSMHAAIRDPDGNTIELYQIVK
jgi:catechol 2,3-dioxygenase-like lactoylglutathione lyase family enzyme